MREVFWYINRKVLNWIVFREKSGGPEMSVIWCRFVRSFIGNVKYYKLIAEKRVEDASEYIWLPLDARSVWYINRKVLNWIVFRDNSYSCLKFLWFIWDRCRFWFVERNYMFDGNRKCLLKKIYNIFDCV